MRYFIVFLLVLKLSAFTRYDIRPKGVSTNDIEHITIYDSIVLKEREIDGLKFCEISDMVYDSDNRRLYMLSDKGKLFWADITINDNKIDSFKLKGGVKLKGYGGKKLLKPYRDSEGMALVRDGGEKLLLISFERKPRVWAYRLDGKLIKNFKLPKKLRDIDKYRGKNRALEALAYSKKRGYITSPEKPLRKYSKKYHRIYDKEGVICKIKKEDRDSSLVEMEMIDDDHILALFRHFHPSSFDFDITLKEIDLSTIKDKVCKTKLLAYLSTKSGWKIDNYEGLAKVDKNLYLMVSDSNQNSFEKMILTLFEIKKE